MFQFSHQLLMIFFKVISTQIFSCQLDYPVMEKRAWSRFENEIKMIHPKCDLISEKKGDKFWSRN